MLTWSENTEFKTVPGQQVSLDGRMFAHFNRSRVCLNLFFLEKVEWKMRSAVRLKQAEKFVNCRIRAMIGIPAVIRNIPASFPEPRLFRNLLRQLISKFEVKFESGE